MKESDKKALKDSLVLMGILVAIFVAAIIIALIILLLIPSSPWLGGAILAAALILLVGLANYFIMR